MKKTNNEPIDEFMEEIEQNMEYSDRLEPYDIYPPEGDELTEIDNRYFTVKGHSFVGDYYETKSRWIRENVNKTLLDFCIETCKKKTF